MLWNEKFVLGVDTIDVQHKKLVDMLEETMHLVDDAKGGHDCYDDIQSLLGQLQDYTVYHFDYEEDLFEKVNYKDAENHHIEHSNFIDKLHEFLDADIDEDQNGNLEEIMEFLLKWLSNHILVTDKMYVDTLTAHNIK